MVSPPDEIRDEGGPEARPVAIRPYPLPPEGFDPSTEPEEVLRRYGLPTPEETGSNQQTADFRRAFLQPPPSGVPPRFFRLLAAGATAPPTGIRSVAAPNGAWPAQKSLNWSGGYITPRDGRSFTSVMAHWTVPEVTEPPGIGALDYHSSTWIGLDGQKFYRDSSLPQIGTRQRFIPGSGPEYRAWFQWWVRGRHLPIWFLQLPVAVRDEISAIITVLDETTVRCNLKNVTQGVFLQAFDAFAPPGLRISGATAEWIMERPSPLGADGWSPYELPRYTTFPFTEALAESKAPGRAGLQQHGLEFARLIRMYKITANPTRVRTISTARRLREPPPPKLELTYVGP